MRDIGDQDLVRACRAGESAAWEELSRRHEGILRRTAARILSRQGMPAGEGNIDEMVAGVMEALVEDGGRRLERYDPRWPLAVWLRVIARGCVLDALRSRRRRERIEASAPPPAEPPDPAAEAARAEMRTRVNTLVDSLPAREKTIVRLYFYADRTCPEIARLLRVPENTVFSMLRRTLEKLRQQM
jgi:RNA polymerase sigma factor (sigma-70 family)